MSGKSAVKVVFGAMTIGKPAREGTRVYTVEDTCKILDVFQAHGHSEIDTARVYGGGTSEEYLGEANWQKRGLVMDTKLYPTLGKNMSWMGAEDYSYKAEDVRKGLLTSLKALKAEKIHMFYLHGPDRNTPLEETLREVNNLYKEGYFERFGISNYHSWEVAEICQICKYNGWIQPTVYQGLYNTWQRVVEAELVPCLRKWGISLYVFNPLAGGFLTSRYSRDQAKFNEGERFDPNKKQGQLHRTRYWHEPYFQALDILRPVAQKHGLSEAECALRWLAHHSVLNKENGDAIIVGASSTKHLEENLDALDKGPLPEDVVQALDDGWAGIRGVPMKFWH